MGLNVQSTVTKQTLNTTTNIVNKVANSITQKVIGKCTAVNISNTVIGGKEFCGAATAVTGSTITINQTAKAGCMLKGSISANISTEELTELKKQLKQQVANEIKNKQGFIPMAISIQSAVNISETTINEKIDKISQNDFKQSCENTASSYNKGIVTICADLTDSNIIINQESYANAVTTCMTTAIIKTIFNTKSWQDVAQEADNQLSSEQEGIGSLFKWLIIVAAIIAFVLIVGVIIYAISGGFSSTPESEGGTGKSSFDNLVASATAAGGGAGGGEGGISPTTLAMMAA